MSEKKSMLSTSQALAQLLAAVRPVEQAETVPTQRANQRVLAENLYSQLDVPPMDNTQMDGYAVRAADCAGGQARLPVSQRIPAGHVGDALLPGTAARIFTGAMIPDGADAVVMQEQCTHEILDGKAFVTIQHTPASGEWIRRRGEDIRAGSLLLPAGTLMRAQELGLAASVGLAQIQVKRKLRVTVLFTGDELTMPGEALKAGAIYNSNRFTLTALLQNLGCVVTDFGIVPDNLEATRASLRQAAQQHDLIITSGGVSVGDEDHVRPAVEAEGRINMWQIAMKPGKPLAFGEIGATYFLGLPGNPVSSFVTFLLFVRPFILSMQGCTKVMPRRYAVRADFSWSKADKRNEFLRVRLNESGGLDLFANQSSAVLTSTVWGDGLVDIAPGQTVQPGDLLQFLPFAELMS